MNDRAIAGAQEHVDVARRVVRLPAARQFQGDREALARGEGDRRVEVHRVEPLSLERPRDGGQSAGQRGSREGRVDSHRVVH